MSNTELRTADQRSAEAICNSSVSQQVCFETVRVMQITETFAESDSKNEHDDTPDPPDLITHVSVDPLTMHDQDALVPAINSTEQRNIKPGKLLADSHMVLANDFVKVSSGMLKIAAPSCLPRENAKAS